MGKNSPSNKTRKGRAKGVSAIGLVGGPRDSQIKRDWGVGTSVTSQGDEARQKQLSVRRAQESIKGLRRALRKAEEDLNTWPGNAIKQEAVSLARKKLQEAEDLANGGNPEK